MTKQANMDVAGKPIPAEVHKAIRIIAEYLHAGGWAECIISDAEGASFHLTSMYDIFFEFDRESPE